MPYQIGVPIQSENENATKHRDLLRPWHAMFYTWLTAGDATIGNRVHDESEPKPFTVGRARKNEKGDFVLPLTLLDDALWEPLHEGLAKLNRFEIKEQAYRICGDVTTTQRDYESLWKDAKTGTGIDLQFLSPTSFHSQGNHYPLPDPFMTFQSYLLRWNHFAPASCQINIVLLDVVTVHIVIAKYRLETEMVDFGGYWQVGFTGFVRYRIKQSEMIGKEMVRRLNALADFATYCGTGHKTTQGMGQTRRVPTRTDRERTF